MIRVTVPRPVAEALMPRPCPHVDCEGEGDTHCWGCHGSGSLPPVLRLLVVEVERELHILHLPDCRLEVQPEPPATIVRVIESGERIGIDVECETCVHLRPGRECIDNPDCIDGRVLVGSVRPVRVMPVVDVWGNPESLPESGRVLDVGGSTPWLTEITSRNQRTLRPVERITDLAVYGPAESLVGKFAVEVEDARREP